MTLPLARDVSAHGIRVNCIAPGTSSRKLLVCACRYYKSDDLSIHDSVPAGKCTHIQVLSHNIYNADMKLLF